MTILSGIFTFFLLILSLCLIVLVVLQTPKSEGFGGGVTNTPGGNFRGKAGYDEMLSNYTRLIAYGWFAIAFVLAVLNQVSGG